MSEWPTSDLPEGWVLTTLGEVAEIVGGGTPRSNMPSNFSESGLAWITPADLTGYDKLYISAGARFLSPEGLANSSARLLPSGTVCMTSRAPIGNVVIASSELATNQGFKSFVLSPEVVPEYLFYWLTHYRSLIEAMGSGSTFFEVSAARCREIPLVLPPLEEQRRIVARLVVAEAERQKSMRRCEDGFALVRSMRQQTLSTACAGLLSAEWRRKTGTGKERLTLLAKLDKTRITAHQARFPRKSYKEAVAPSGHEHEPLPESWMWASFDQCAEAITVGHVGPMSTRYTQKGIPFLRSQNVRPMRYSSEGLVFIAKDFHRELAKSKLIGGELLVTRSGANVGDCCAYPRGAGEANCADLVITRLLPGVLPDYATIWLNSTEGKAHILRKETGIAQQHFNVGAMRTTPIPLPPLDEQREIIRCVEEMLSKADTIEAEFQRLRTEADSTVLAAFVRAFRGELVLTEASLARAENRSYEDGAALLTRIKSEMSQRKARPRPKQPKSRNRMKTLTPEQLKDSIRKLPGDRFSFSDLRNAAPGDYDTLQRVLFQLLDEPTPVVCQVFDKTAKKMQFQRMTP